MSKDGRDSLPTLRRLSVTATTDKDGNPLITFENPDGTYTIFNPALLNDDVNHNGDDPDHYGSPEFITRLLEESQSRKKHNDDNDDVETYGQYIDDSDDDNDPSLATLPQSTRHTNIADDDADEAPPPPPPLPSSSLSVSIDSQSHSTPVTLISPSSLNDSFTEDSLDHEEIEPETPTYIDSIIRRSSIPEDGHPVFVPVDTSNNNNDEIPIEEPFQAPIYGSAIDDDDDDDVINEPKQHDHIAATPFHLEYPDDVIQPISVPLVHDVSLSALALAEVPSQQQQQQIATTTSPVFTDDDDDDDDDDDANDDFSPIDPLSPRATVSASYHSTSVSDTVSLPTPTPPAPPKHNKPTVTLSPMIVNHSGPPTPTSATPKGGLTPTARSGRPLPPLNPSGTGYIADTSLVRSSSSSSSSAVRPHTPGQGGVDSSPLPPPPPTSPSTLSQPPPPPMSPTSSQPPPMSPTSSQPPPPPTPSHTRPPIPPPTPALINGIPAGQPPPPPGPPPKSRSSAATPTHVSPLSPTGGSSGNQRFIGNTSSFFMRAQGSSAPSPTTTCSDSVSGSYPPTMALDITIPSSPTASGSTHHLPLASPSINDNNEYIAEPPIRPDLLAAHNASSPHPLADLQTVGQLQVHGRSNDVTDVTRVSHFSFDPDQGLSPAAIPPEWRGALSKRFGIPIQLCATQVVPGYVSRLPPVLIYLKRHLIENGGLNQVGIFRLAPLGHDAHFCKASLNNSGTMKPDTDVNVAAHLLKVWYRDMPLLLLDVIKDKSCITTCPETPQAAGAVIEAYYTEPHKTLLLWLLDLCCDVAENEPVNKMGPANMAIVFSPNLFKPPTMTAAQDSAAAIRLCKKYTSFFEHAIEWRAQLPDRPRGY